MQSGFMPQISVIADDLTGANVTGGLLAKEGFSTSLVFGDGENAAGCDAVIRSTDSRALPAGEAYRKVSALAGLEINRSARLLVKRIDSTLRGPVGAELAAMSEACGGDRLCLIVPSFPGAGRIVINGELFLNGKPLHKTAAAGDPLNPIDTSNVSSILRASMHPGHVFDFEHLTLATVRDGGLRKIFQGMHEKGIRFVLLDAETDGDIGNIASESVKSGVKLIIADPGPLTHKVAIGMFGGGGTGKVLLAVGSIVATTKIQVERAVEGLSPAHAVLDTKLLLDPKLRAGEINRAASVLCGSAAPFLLLTLTTLDPENRLDFQAIAAGMGETPEGLSRRVNGAIAETARAIYENIGLSALFASGGDIAVAACKAFQASGVRLADEVAPLTSLGFLNGGIADGLPIVTKGGLVGGTGAIVESVEYLSKAVRIASKGRN